MEPPQAGRERRGVLNDPFDCILGRSAAAEAMRAFGRRAAAVDAPVLLLGESGTGKGVLARAIHEASARARRAFVAVNCAAVPDALFESEFFGHVRGAFTGAQYAHKGLLEQADGGTLFLDEVAELSLPAQAKLLTSIEDRQVRRVGGERQLAVNARIIAATATDLHEAVLGHTFRLDLLHRLSVLSCHLPPLRFRAEDILQLADHFLAECARRYNRAHCVFDEQAAASLLSHCWNGNVRELANVIEAAVVAAPTACISVTDVLHRNAFAGGRFAPAPLPLSEREEQQRIEGILRQCHGNKTRAARVLGIARTTLWLKLKRFQAANTVQANTGERAEDVT